MYELTVLWPDMRVVRQSMGSFDKCDSEASWILNDQNKILKINISELAAAAVLEEPDQGSKA